MNLDNNKGEAWAESKQSRPSLFQNWALDYWEPIITLHASLIIAQFLILSEQGLSILAPYALQQASKIKLF